MTGNDLTLLLKKKHRDNGMKLLAVDGQFQLHHAGVIDYMEPGVTVAQVWQVADDYVNWNDSGVRYSFSIN